MTLKRQCDRCGRQEDFHMSGSWRKVRTYPGSNLEDELDETENEQPQFTSGRDLCGQCIFDFEKKFMSNKQMLCRVVTDTRFV